MQKLVYTMIPFALAVAIGCTPFKSASVVSKLAGETTLATPAAAVTPVTASKPAPVGPPPEPTQTEAMAEIAPMLAKIASVDPELHAEVLDQLSGSQPRLWSLTAQQAIQKLEYRQQLAAQQAVPTSTTPTIAKLPPTNPVVQASATVTPPIPPAASTMPQVVGGVAPAPVIENAYAAATPEPVRVASRDITPLASATVLEPASATPEPIEPEEPKTWREHLASAIATLDETAAKRPHSKREAYERVKLQLLQLVAGETDDAVVSTPGLSSAEQGYWSNQLYALSTMLENRGDDDQATADEAARHQAEASAKLRALGTLQVRNFVTCREVYDYGAYTPFPEARYAPGEKVILYAEIDNYHSDATADGYRTTLASSYRLVDRHGDEVAAGDIPKVDDLCLTRRRDFHIEYRVTLPGGLAAGEYTLELTVNDQLGDKLGHAEAPLTVSLR